MFVNGSISLYSAVCIIFISLLSSSKGTQHVVTEHGEVLVPLSFKLSDGSNKQLHFSFTVHEENLEQLITNYCEVQNIRYHFCHKLFAYMQQIQTQVQSEERDQYVITKKYRTSEQGSQYQRPSSFHNPNLIKYPTALHAHLKRSLRHARRPTGNSLLPDEEMMMDIEMRALTVLKSMLQKIYEEEEIVRIAVIHSEDYNNAEGNRELRLLLDSLKDNALMNELQLILVLQYGNVISQDSALPIAYPDVTFIHLSDDQSFGELPSLRVVQALARYLTTSLLSSSDDQHNLYKDVEVEPVHILYMRTLSTEFQNVHNSLEDWRNLLLYYLVEEHWSCFHLIESREIDVVAVNFINNPRALNGNYFWASSHFLAQLPMVPYNFPRFESIASEWLFTSPMMKIYVPHISRVNHELTSYPRYCYAPSGDGMIGSYAPSYEEYKKICSKKSLEDFSLLHNQSALAGSDFPAYSEDFHNINSPREVTSSCSTLELSIVFDS